MPFRNEDDRRRHFFKHGPDFGAASSEDYERRADAFLSGRLADGVEECVRSAGGRVRYNEATGEFGVLYADGFVATYFRRRGTVAERRQYFVDNCT
jgi:pyocin large subunit-like protein